MKNSRRLTDEDVRTQYGQQPLRREASEPIGPQGGRVLGQPRKHRV